MIRLCFNRYGLNLPLVYGSLTTVFTWVHLMPHAKNFLYFQLGMSTVAMAEQDLHSVAVNQQEMFHILRTALETPLANSWQSSYSLTVDLLCMVVCNISTAQGGGGSFQR